MKESKDQEEQQQTQQETSGMKKQDLVGEPKAQGQEVSKQKDQLEQDQLGQEKKPRQNISGMKIEGATPQEQELTDKQRRRYRLEGWLVAILLVIIVLIMQVVRKNDDGDKGSLLDNQQTVTMVSTQS